MADQLLLIALGREDILLQARYAAASALAWREGAEFDLRILTDRPEAFAPLRGRALVEAVSPARLRAWRGRWDFMFRVKPAAIAEALRDAGGRVLFVDADTYFTAPVDRALARIAGGAAAMHAREYHVATHPSRQLRRFRRRLGRSRFRGAPIELDHWMWNSGAVGLDAGHLPLVEEWLAFVDEVFPTNPKPIVEQFGLSYVLQRAGVAIAPVDDVLRHYFDDKPRVMELLPGRLAAIEGLEPEAAALRVRERPPSPEGPPPPRRRPGFLERVRTSLRQRLDLVRARRGR